MVTRATLPVLFCAGVTEVTGLLIYIIILLIFLFLISMKVAKKISKGSEKKDFNAAIILLMSTEIYSKQSCQIKMACQNVSRNGLKIQKQKALLRCLNGHIRKILWVA